LSESNSSVRLSPLDGLRGIASLIIVILHYRNLNDKWNEAIINTNPFWDQLILVYKFGWIAVEFFFVLSGFIFFWKYGEMISEKAITLTNFAVLRLTRLYPLHVATLILTGFLQYLVWAKSNVTFIYGNNDFYHLILQLTFLNYGWVEVGHSFNAPAWSIALEMGMYFLFYAACFGRKNRPLIALGLMMLFLQVNIRGPIANFPMLNEPFTRVGYCFFMGGLLHFLYSKVKSAPKIMEYVGMASLAGTVLVLYCIQSYVVGNTALATLIGPRFNNVITLGVFPMLITCGLFAWLGLLQGVEVDSLFAVSLITVAGYSVTDTVVVYDRIREQKKALGSLPLVDQVDVAVDATLTRSLYTSLTTLLPLFGLALFGGSSLYWFAIALIVGIGVGSWSSIGLAPTLLPVLSKR